AELIAGELARTAGLPVPELVFVILDPEIAKTEPDPEIQDLIRASGGLKLWLIDHGAALYFHHSWTDMDRRTKDPFALIKDHILLPFASALETVDGPMTSTITKNVIREIVELVPDDWMQGNAPFPTAAENRQAYVEYLLRRLEEPRYFLEEAIRARSVPV